MLPYSAINTNICQIPAVSPSDRILASMYNDKLFKEHCQVYRQIENVLVFTEVFCIDNVFVLNPFREFLAEDIKGRMGFIA